MMTEKGAMAKDVTRGRDMWDGSQEDEVTSCWDKMNAPGRELRSMPHLPLLHRSLYRH